MRSLTVYSNVRTEAEIKKDMTRLDKSDLLVHYDFSSLSEKNPKVIKNSRTLLPIRFLAENLGATVTWNDATKTATFVK
ncbi:MAG: hypothetical protein IIX18_03720 [Clostridia bacterium]|nr:hypothetical protein [Clostridia bacterium]